MKLREQVSEKRTGRLVSRSAENGEWYTLEAEFDGISLLKNFESGGLMTVPADVPLWWVSEREIEERLGKGIAS